MLLLSGALLVGMILAGNKLYASVSYFGPCMLIGENRTRAWMEEGGEER
jgi:hypothetical protein